MVSFKLGQRWLVASSLGGGRWFAASSIGVQNELSEGGLVTVGGFFTIVGVEFCLVLAAMCIYQRKHP